MYQVSVAICNYQQKKWLHRCLRSLCDQTMCKDDFEVIIINDDTNENLDDIVSVISDYINCKLINNRENIGLPASLNIALKKSLGRYFIRLDCDDYFSKHCLYMLSVFLDMNRNYQAIACDYKRVNEIGQNIEIVSAQKEPIACGIMFSYESLAEVGFYNEEMKMREGHELLTRFIKKYNLFYLPIPLYRYRMHQDNRTKNQNQILMYDKKLEEQ